MRTFKRNLSFTILVGCLFSNLKMPACAQSIQPVPPVQRIPSFQSDSRCAAIESALLQPVQPIPSVQPVQPAGSIERIQRIQPIQHIELIQPTQTEKPLQTVLSGSVCSERVHELTTAMPWFTDLHKAEDQARAQNKLVFWLHMVGKIDGAT
jgi:hypothetical protein